MRKDIFKKNGLISKSVFFASGLLNIGAMNSENNIQEETTIEETTVKSDVDESLETIRKARKYFLDNFRENFENIINKKNYKYRKDPFFQTKRIGSINPLYYEKLFKKNEELYKILNEIFNGNFFTDFKFYNILDQNIKLNSICDYVNNLPSIKKLWSIYGEKGYSLKLTNMYKYITSLNKENIDNFSDKNNSKRESCELNKKDSTLGQTEENKNYISLKITDCFLNNIKKNVYKNNFNGESLAEKFKEQFLNEIYGNKGTIFHELNHFNNDIIEILSYKEKSNETDSFTAIESDIYKIIRYYCKVYYDRNNKNNKKLFLSSKISEILDFINKKLTVEDLEYILEIYQDEIYNNEVKNVNYSKKLKRIKEFLSLGSRKQQCKLLEILSYVGNVLIKHNNKNVRDNLSKYSTTKIDEMSAECGSFSLLAKDEYNKYSEILFAFEYSYITKFVDKQNYNSTNCDILYRFILKEKIREKVELIDKYDEYILDILKSIKTENCSENTATIKLNIRKKYKEDYNKLHFDKKFYKYLILTLTKEEEENLKKSDDESINKLLKEYEKKIKYTDFLEDCYVDNIMNESLGLKTYFFKLEYKSEHKIDSDNDLYCDSDDDSDDTYLQEIKFEVKKISESEIKTTVDKIKKLMEDFYKYLFKKNDKNLEKLNTLDKVQLICIFYRILNDNKEEDRNFYKYECNTLDSIVINNILRNIIIEKNVKYSLKEQKNKEIEKLNIYKNFDFFEVEDIRKANDDIDIDHSVNYKKFKTLVGDVVKELNIELEKNKDIDDCKVILYINKDYLENIKKDIFKEFSSNDNIFWICKNFDNDRDSKKCNYYFDKSNFVKNDLSEVKKKKENIDETYESFNEKYKKIIDIFKDFDGDYFFYDLYNKYCPKKKKKQLKKEIIKNYFIQIILKMNIMLL